MKGLKYFMHNIFDSSMLVPSLMSVHLNIIKLSKINYLYIYF